VKSYTVTLLGKATGDYWTMTWYASSFADAERRTIRQLDQVWHGDGWRKHHEIIRLERDHE